MAAAIRDTYEGDMCVPSSLYSGRNCIAGGGGISEAFPALIPAREASPGCAGDGSTKSSSMSSHCKLQDEDEDEGEGEGCSFSTALR